jgi:hypothetical protein
MNGTVTKKRIRIRRRKRKLTNFEQHKYCGGSGTVLSLGRNLRNS